MIRPEDVRSLTDFKRNTPAQLKELRKSGRPRLLTINGKAAVIVQDPEAYQKMLDAVDRAEAIEGIKRGLADAKAGRTMSVDDAFASIRRRARARRAS